MNRLTQWRLNYIATFIPQHEQGILNFIHRKFNNSNFKVSIFKIRHNSYLSKWYCSYFGFNYGEMIKSLERTDYKFVKWIIKNNLFSDFKIAINCFFNESKLWSIDKYELSVYLVKHGLTKYLKSLMKSQYIDYKILIVQVYHFKGTPILGLIPYCIYKNYDDMLNYIVKIIPKKYMNVYFDDFKCYCHAFDNVQTRCAEYKNLAHYGNGRLKYHLVQKYNDFIKKYNLLTEQKN